MKIYIQIYSFFYYYQSKKKKTKGKVKFVLEASGKATSLKLQNHKIEKSCFELNFVYLKIDNKSINVKF